MELLENILAAHGGRENWEKYKKVSVTMIGGGTLVTLQQLPQNRAERTVTAWLHEQRAGVKPFGAPDAFSDITPQRVAIENESGQIIAERKGDAHSLHQEMKHGLWGPLGLATFNGYALWQYINFPFFMLLPGIQVKEIAPYTERNETWRVLEVTFPDDMLSHSKVQQFYFDDNYLLRRQDYTVDVAVEEKNTFNVAQYIYDYREAQGLRIGTVRRMYHRNDDGTPNMLDLAIWADLSDLTYHL
ncbi:hypothetical protein D0C36_18515 [Mucilaginibacter conchicola]|uniref:Uncharacterized protein n=1 Tax=Mucilaginibacter conchicola TaxID=2303333 RepID=A0A372NQL3_9SPHI|nr:hypothetical protein [Mucilaginibacter conchicola]RFZ90940.1 hypothetical protein D0C36_18515 [Mucilaginibacter conchicola]